MALLHSYVWCCGGRTLAFTHESPPGGRLPSPPRVGATNYSYAFGRLRRGGARRRRRRGKNFFPPPLEKNDETPSLEPRETQKRDVGEVAEKREDEQVGERDATADPCHQ